MVTNRIRILFGCLACISLFTFANAVSAGDLSTALSCVERGYSVMDNHSAIVVAVLDGTTAQTRTFGTATRGQLFEIGSITKTFTANLLAQSVVNNSVRLADPIPTAYQKSDVSITYQHLTTHTSGLPSGNFTGYDSGNPLAPYDGISDSLFRSLYQGTALAFEPGQSWSYSNLGVSLLGLILGENGGVPYQDLVRTNILEPLGMHSTYFHVPDTELARFPQGNVIINGGDPMPAPYWDLSNNALAPAGGIRSTIDDMIVYARANLVSGSTPLSDAVRLSHQPLFSVSPSMSIAMNWLINQENGVIWHNGATAGFNAVIALSLADNVAVVALTNTAAFMIDSQGRPEIDMNFTNVALNCLH